MMNLTISLRNQLIEAVLKDQLQADFDKLKLKLKKEVNRLADKANDGYYAVAAKALKDAGANPDEFLTSKNRATLNNLKGRKLLICENGSHSIYGFRLNDSIDIENPHLCNDNWRPIELEGDAESKKLTDEITEFYKSAASLKGDLRAVLFSVKNVKKLQELTKIFDPFLPKDAAVTTLVPTESILKLNELKSPKTTKKAA